MKIAIVHHHLRPGGVTRVIESAVKSLLTHGLDVAVFSAGPAQHVSTALKQYWVLVPELDYQDHVGGAVKLEKSLFRAANKRWGSEPDLWHVHNHSLGKNPAWTQIVGKWAVSGRAMVLQMHDFAEDGRSELYRRLKESPSLFDSKSGKSGKSGPCRNLTADLYPDAPNVFYTCLNGRDFHLLTQKSIPAERVRLLPNPVGDFKVAMEPLDQSTGLDVDAEEIWLYPTRSIRRKNIGEALYWAMHMEPGQAVALTLPPNNPESLPIYQDWVAFADKHRLPAFFETGLRSELSFQVWCRGCDRFLTTSVAEGFGMAFLESWTHGKTVFGRDLPEITQDFEKSGLDLRGLYTSLPVSLNGLDISCLRQEWLQDYGATMEAYGNWNLDTQKLAQSFLDHWLAEEKVDFGQLKEKYQRQVLERDSSQTKRATKSLEHLFHRRNRGISEKNQIRKNQQVLKEKYSEQNYGVQLVSLYQEILSQKPASSSSASRGEFFDSQPILEAFLGPERFQWLRT